MSKCTYGAFEHTVAIPHTQKWWVEKRDALYSKKAPEESFFRGRGC
jgi:hypothetical protein